MGKWTLAAALVAIGALAAALYFGVLNAPFGFGQPFSKDNFEVNYTLGSTTY